ncbi:MAG TPA: hypothetical protein PKM27_10665 [Saprospiraceae bacterium]|nr:hypothetical protein [Saprospiraceae bacterium]HNT19384.1 hypothetical protein [Saprospiraceae bacterium]
MKKGRNLLWLAFWSCLLFYQCGPAGDEKDPQYLADLAIKAHGSKVFDQSIIEFKFRDRYYKSTRKDGKFIYERFWDSVGTVIHDVLDNRGFSRIVDQTEVILDAKKKEAFSNSLRGVFYFFGLPFQLNDPPVIKEYLGEVMLMEQPYHKLKIRFKPDPADQLIHDDVYVFWIHKKNHTVDYLAYSYTEPNERGLRFRQAINPRKIEGLRVQDYINYKPIRDSSSLKVEDMDMAWAGNQLTEMSRIINENVKIRLNKN